MIDGKPKIVLKEDDNFEAVIEAIKNKDAGLIKRLVDKAGGIETMTQGKIKVINNKVMYGDEECHGVVVDKILSFLKENLDATPLLNFLDKLLQNPSKSCLDQLYQFLENKNLPIDPDGDFYAYKAIRNDWTDKHTGTIRNQIGDTPEVTRNKVDDNPDNACSYGLHVGSIEYVREFGKTGDKYVIVKVNPADAVSVPTYDTRKMRCCKYTVVEEFVDELPENTYTTVATEELGEEIWEDDDYDDEAENDYLGSIGMGLEDELDDYDPLTVPAMDREEVTEALDSIGVQYSKKSNTKALQRKLIKSLS